MSSKPNLGEPDSQLTKNQNFEEFIGPSAHLIQESQGFSKERESVDSTEPPIASAVHGGREVSNKILHVSGLHKSVDEQMISDVFSDFGTLKLVKLLNDKNKLGFNYAFVEFNEPSCATKALTKLNGENLNQYPIIIKRAYHSSNANSVQSTEPVFNIFVGDLSPEVDDEALNKAFSHFKSIREAHVMWDMQTSRSRGYGFVTFLDQIDAQTAVNTMNGKVILGRAVRCNWASHKQQLNNKRGRPPPQLIASPLVQLQRTQFGSPINMATAHHLHSLPPTPSGHINSSSNLHHQPQLMMGGMQSFGENIPIPANMVPPPIPAGPHQLSIPMTGNVGINTSNVQMPFRTAANSSPSIVNQNRVPIVNRDLTSMNPSPIGNQFPVHQPSLPETTLGSSSSNSPGELISHFEMLDLAPERPIPLISPQSYETVLRQTPNWQTTVYLGNIAHFSQEADILPLMQNFGYIVDFKFHPEKGCAFVKYDSHERAALAIVQSAGLNINGRPLKCGWGKGRSAYRNMSQSYNQR